MDLLRLQSGPLSVDEAMCHVAHHGAGGVCVFVGTVRDHSDGNEGVERLEYEAYEEAVEQAMTKVAALVHSAVPRVRLAILHRHGVLELGEVSVVVAASAPHRAEAFAAARLAIDQVKETVPIWKKEHRADGTSEWVACHQAPGAVADDVTLATPSGSVRQVR